MGFTNRLAASVALAVFALTGAGLSWSPLSGQFVGGNKLGSGLSYAANF